VVQIRAARCLPPRVCSLFANYVSETLWGRAFAALVAEPRRGQPCLVVLSSRVCSAHYTPPPTRLADERRAGIVQGTAQVVAFDKRPGFATLRATFPRGSVEGVAVGTSVAVNGTCLTVTQQPQRDELCFDLIVETLRATNLGLLQVGSSFNFERSARIGDEVGGHNVSGHVQTTAVIAEVEDTPSNRKVVFALPERFTKYIFPKARER